MISGKWQIFIHGHRFRIFTLVSEIHENVDLVFGIRNLFELEGIINSQESYISFLNRLIPFFLKTNCFVTKRTEIDKKEAPFAIIKLLDRKTLNTMMLKLKFIRNLATLDVTNSSLETVIFDPEEMLGILHLRLIGYYKIKQGVLQQNLS